LLLVFPLLAGWQFDSEVRMVRGREAENADDVRLINFPETPCENTPEQEIYLLARDFKAVFPRATPALRSERQV